MTMCPDEISLESALDARDPAIATHVASCATCRDRIDRVTRAIELARELPAIPPSTQHREEIRTAVLAAASLAGRIPEHASRRRAWVATSISVAAAIAIGVVAIRVIHPGTPVAARAHGTIHPDPNARFSTSAPPDEIVRLEDGRISIEVSPLRPGERFRVVVGDAEIEVRGTAFEVIAAADHLVAVSVTHGRVDVRPTGSPMATLGAGESWHVVVAKVDVPATPPIAIAVKPVAPPVPAVVSERRDHHVPAIIAAPAQTPATKPARPVESLAYDDAWTAMRAASFADAATAFARVAAIAPRGPLAEDAQFWRAVALSRAKRRDAAVGAFREFLETHPSAARNEEASVMLGWLLLEGNELDEADRRFHAGANATSATVRASARAGIAALHPPIHP